MYVLVSVAIFGSFNDIIAQEEGETVEYTILENRPRSPFLELHVSPLEARGANMGPGINGKVRVHSRLLTEVNAFSAMYLNNYKSNYDGNSPDAFKKSGGIYLDASANFVWRKSKIKVEGQSEKFILDSKTTQSYYTQTTETKYLPFQYNTTIERFLKVGGYYDVYPLDYNTLSGAGLVFGLHSSTNKYATVKIGEHELTNRREIKKGLNVFLGNPVYEVDSLSNGSPIGLSLFMGTVIGKSNSSNKRILQSFDFNIELGVRPGGVGFLGFRLGFPILRFGNQYLTPKDTEFKEIGTPNSKMRRWTLGV